MDCRQWGAHFPHVAGIAGQGNVGAQSVVLSGGYEDDRDEGEWFLYTGSGGRDLSGNKRTNNVQSFDQVFEKMNKALKLSCVKGLPVRVVRSYKEKRSAYAPSEDTPVRYDGLYRIVRCWRKKGQQGHLMCRYLFVRCDNEPAPWSIEGQYFGVYLGHLKHCIVYTLQHSAFYTITTIQKPAMCLWISKKRSLLKHWRKCVQPTKRSSTPWVKILIGIIMLLQSLGAGLSPLLQVRRAVVVLAQGWVKSGLLNMNGPSKN